MADYWPSATGVWSNLTNWLTAAATTAGRLPNNTDDVYADGKTVYIDINAQASRLLTTQRTGGTVGGFFYINNGVTLTANITAGTTACVTFSSASPSTCTIVGNISGSSSTSVFCVNNTSTGTITISGEVGSSLAGTGSYGVYNTSIAPATINIIGNVVARASTAAYNNSTGTINVTGNVFASSTTSGIIGLQNGTYGSINIVGNVYGGSSGGNAYGVFNGGNGTVTIVGNVSGAAVVTATGYGVYNNSAGTINIIGSSTGYVAPGTINTSTGTVNLTGNTFGGTSNSSPGITNSSFGTVNVIGNAIGGSGTNNYGINNASNGAVTVSGTAIGGIGSNANGLNNASTGYVYVRAVSGNAYGLGNSTGISLAAGASNSQTGSLYVEEFYFGTRGATPIVGPVYIVPKSNNTLVGVVTAAGSSVTFYNSLSVSNLVPPTSSVRSGVVYDVGNGTGTMTVPSSSSVLLGTLVDNTSGIAALAPNTIWDYSRLSATDVNSIGGRLKDTITTQALGQQIASFNL